MEYNVQELVINEQEIIDKDIRCQICMCLVVNPVECIECQHDFCSQCIQQTQQKCPYKCPDAEFQESHRRTRGILSNLILKCPNFSRGCLKNIKMDQINSHIREDCQFLLYQCNNKGCVAIIYDFIKQQHNQVCKYKVIKCKECQQLYKQFNYHNCLTDAVNGLKKKQKIIKEQQKQINQLQEQINNLEQINKNQQVISLYKCNKFHKLKWHRFQQPRTCTQCNKVYYSCYSCLICDVRYCITCKPPIIFQDRCIEGHKLKFFENAEQFCTMCHKGFKGVYIDEECKFLCVCSKCYQGFQ